MLRCCVLVLTLALAGQTAAQTDALAAAQAYDEGRFEAAIDLLTRVLATRGLSLQARGEAHWNRGLAYVRTGEKDKALADFGAFTALFPDDDDGPSKLVELGVEMRRYPEAARALASLFDRFPNRVRERKWEVVEIARDLEMKGQWRQADDILGRYGAIDFMDATINFSRARTAAALNRPGEALDLIGRSASQHNLVLARADKSFAALWNDPDFVKVTDLQALFERDLARAEGGPEDSLFTIVLRINALWHLGRFQEASELGDRTLASDLSRFGDRFVREAQLHEQTARVAQSRGDLATAERAFRIGIERVGNRNESIVTLLLSAAQFLASTQGKYREALEFADYANRIADAIRGGAVGDSVRPFAYWGLKQQSDLNRILGAVERNLSENQNIAVDLYLLLGRRDDAAKLVASQLAHPGYVDGMLVNLQRYTKNRPATGAVETLIEAGWEALREHPAVVAALKDVGRITQIPAANRY